MANPLPIEQLERLRHGSRRLADQATINENDVHHLLRTAQLDLREAEAALASAEAVSTNSVEQLSEALRHHISRQVAGIAEARRLCVRARQHQLAADRLVNELDDTNEVLRPGRSRAVLVVDDLRGTRDFLSMTLHQAGFTVCTAENGLEAILTAYNFRPAVIVMDVTMPVLDGIEATRLIKAIDELRSACVIAYTAWPLNERRLAADSLFSAVLPKPSPPDAVVATVKRYAA
jgi:two-component system cell cycle response regulator DivK